MAMVYSGQSSNCVCSSLVSSCGFDFFELCALANDSEYNMLGFDRRIWRWLWRGNARVMIASSLPLQNLKPYFSAFPCKTPETIFFREEQWSWLESQLRDEDSSPEFHVLISSVQVFTSNPFVESWGHFPKERLAFWRTLFFLGLTFVSTGNGLLIFSPNISHGVWCESLKHVCCFSFS